MWGPLVALALSELRYVLPQQAEHSCCGRWQAPHSQALIRLPQGLPRGASGSLPPRDAGEAHFSPVSFLGNHLPSSGCLQWAPTSEPTALEAGGVGVGVGSIPQPCSGPHRVPSHSRPLTTQTSNPSATADHCHPHSARPKLAHSGGCLGRVLPGMTPDQFGPAVLRAPLAHVILPGSEGLTCTPGWELPI